MNHNYVQECKLLMSLPAQNAVYSAAISSRRRCRAKFVAV